MPSFSSFALALVTRSDCLLAHSGLRFPSSTYFMGHLHDVWSCCERHIQSYAPWRGAPMAHHGAGAADCHKGTASHRQGVGRIRSVSPLHVCFVNQKFRLCPLIRSFGGSGTGGWVFSGKTTRKWFGWRLPRLSP